MVLYKELGYETEKEYYDNFIENLLLTNHTFDYFINWNKVYANLKENITEISILNSLNKVPKEEVEDEFIKILQHYPEVVPVLPSIIAVRYKNKRNKIVEIFDEKFKEYDFNDETFIIDDILYFCKRSGILELFTNINDLYTYLLGTEVGLDTNGRKNRSGTIYETLIQESLEKQIEKYDGYSLECQEYVQNINYNKKADFIISYKGHQQLIFECNFFSSTGSKPISEANRYIDLQREIKNENMKFIWITDGAGWNKMEKTLKSVSPYLDYIINYKLLEKKLKKLII